jgi:hypothetical protein
MKEAHYNSIHQQYAIQQIGGGWSIPDLIGTEQQTLQGEPEVVEANNVRMHSSPRTPRHLREPGNATRGGREAGKVLVGVVLGADRGQAGSVAAPECGLGLGVVVIEQLPALIGDGGPSARDGGVLPIG